MVSPDDRILYDHEDDEPSVVSPGRVAMGLAVATVFGIAYFGWGFVGNNETALVSEPVELSLVVATGFDASSSDFKACEGTRPAYPDFSIVVGGVVPADGHQVVSRVVQFVVVDNYHDYRYGRDVRAQGLCTLP